MPNAGTVQERIAAPDPGWVAPPAPRLRSCCASAGPGGDTLHFNYEEFQILPSDLHRLHLPLSSAWFDTCPGLDANECALQQLDDYRMLIRRNKGAGKYPDQRALRLDRLRGYLDSEQPGVDQPTSIQVDVIGRWHPNARGRIRRSNLCFDQFRIRLESNQCAGHELVLRRFLRGWRAPDSRWLFHYRRYERLCLHFSGLGRNLASEKRSAFATLVVGLLICRRNQTRCSSAQRRTARILYFHGFRCDLGHQPA